MKLFNYSLLFSFILLTFFSCRQDEEVPINTNTTLNPPVVQVIASFNGIIKDQDENPLENAQIWIGNDYTSSDENGFYKITSKANSNGTYLKVVADGFFDAYANVIPSGSGISFVNFQMQPKDQVEEFNSEMGGTVNNEEHSIDFQANSIIDEDGKSYNGPVTVYTSFIDPSSEDYNEVFPGDLAAITENNEIIGLRSLGMLNVELFGANGQPLNINSSATLTMKIPESLLEHAPDEIPLWYFDTEMGLWIEDGSATQVDGYYIGEVNHFTLWNCDAPFDLVTLSGEVRATNLVPNIKVCITPLSTNNQRCIYTDNQGYFTGLVPANETLNISVLDQCDNIVADNTLPPSSSDFYVTVNINATTYNEVNISGSILDCDGNIVTNGYALISLPNEGSKFAIADGQGNFSSTLINCSNENIIEVVATDSENNVQSDKLTFPINNNTVSTGSINACGNDITYGFFAENTLGLTITWPIISVDYLDPQANGFLGATYNVEEDQGNGNKVIHQYTFINWDPNNITDPVLAYTVETLIIGNPIPSTFEFNLDGAQLVDTEDYIEMNMSDSEYTDPQGVTHPINLAIFRAPK